MSEHSTSDWLELKDENDFSNWFFKEYCENLRRVISDLVKSGVTDEQLNRELLPKCGEIYILARQEALTKFRLAKELKDEYFTKH